MRSLVLLACLGTTAYADDPGRPLPVAVHAKLDGGVARLSLRYRIPVAHASHRELGLTMPAFGVATAATVTIDGERHPLALARRADSKIAFDAIVEGAAGRPRRWAVELSRGDLGDVVVDLAAAHGGVITIDLEVEADTCFVGDRRYVQIPSTWQHADHEIVRSDQRDACTGASNDSDDERAWIRLATDEASARPFGEQRVTTTAGRLDVAHGHFARVELALAKQLTQIAPDLYTVFVIDSSRSISSTQRALQTETIQSYAERAGESHVQVVSYARKARPLFAGWQVAAHAKLGALDAIALENGSNLDVGLAMANQLLADVHGTRRIVVFTDQRASDRVRALHGLQTRLTAGTLVHVVALAEGHPLDDVDAIVRDDKILFADLARATEGLAATARSTTTKLDALRLVRPLELDHVALATPGWTTASLERPEAPCSTRLREGAACTWWGTGAASASTPQLTGLLWNHPITRALPLVEQTRTLARMLSDDKTLGEAARDVADAAVAINGEWSMLAQWGGTAGYADLDLEVGYGASGCGCGRGSGVGGAWDSGRIIMNRGTFEEQIEKGIAACHVAQKIEIGIELTLDEIVDVQVATPDPAIRDCVTEAVWDVPLWLDQPAPHAHRTVVLFAA